MELYQHNNHHQHHCHSIIVILQKQFCSIIQQVSLCVCVCVCCIFNGVVRRPSQRGGLLQRISQTLSEGERRNRRGWWEDNCSNYSTTVSVSPSSFLLHTHSLSVFIYHAALAELHQTTSSRLTNRFLKVEAGFSFLNADGDSIRQHVSYRISASILTK